jgi:hypothetical protein
LKARLPSFTTSFDSSFGDCADVVMPLDVTREGTVRKLLNIKQWDSEIIKYEIRRNKEIKLFYVLDNVPSLFLFLFLFFFKGQVK